MVDWLKGKGFGGGSDDIDQLTKTINEQSDEQRRILAQFNKAMNEFAVERSLETCLDSLNISMQLANIRGKLAESYEYYARLLEHEITRLRRTKPPP
jgi:methyl-accepting chemotaxis protein